MSINIKKDELRGSRTIIKTVKDKDVSKEVLEIGKAVEGALGEHAKQSKHLARTIDLSLELLMDRITQRKRAFRFDVNRDGRGFIKSIDITEK